MRSGSAYRPIETMRILYTRHSRARVKRANPESGGCRREIPGSRKRAPRNDDDLSKETPMTFEYDLKTSVRTIPDYPKPGILLRDITTLLADARALHRAVA